MCTWCNKETKICAGLPQLKAFCREVFAEILKEFGVAKSYSCILWSVSCSWKNVKAKGFEWFFLSLYQWYSSLALEIFFNSSVKSVASSIVKKLHMHGLLFSTVSLHLGFRVYHTTGILWSQCCDKIHYMCRSGWWQWARQSQFQWFRKYMTVDIAILEKIMCKSFLRKHHRLTAHWPISEQCSCNLWNFHFCWGLRQSLLLPHAISTYSCDKQLQLPERAEKPYSLNCWASSNAQAATFALCFQCYNFNQ